MTWLCVQHPDAAAVAPCARCERPFCTDCLVEIVGRLYCAPCKVEQVRDLQSGADGMNLELAPIDRRLVALIVDGALVVLPFWLIVLFFDQFVPRLFESPRVAEQVAVGIGLAWLAVGYEGALLAWRGQTLGKRAIGIKVVGTGGEGLRPGQAWIRAVARVVLSALVVVDYLPALFTRERVSLHDLLARTRVVRWDD